MSNNINDDNPDSQPDPDRYLYESITKVKHSDLSIRCWRQEEVGYDEAETRMTVKRVISKALEGGIGIRTPRQIAALLIKTIPNASAVEVVDYYEQGTVIYKNWP
jgi:hypothetical protein